MTANPLLRLGAVVLLSGCYTTTNVATLAPLHTAYPVSASGQYVDQHGEIVSDDSYEIVQPFSFTRNVEAPTHGARVTTLAFEPDLDRIVNASHGDAITHMKIGAQNYDVGSHPSSASWKILGWLCGLTGATFVVAGALADGGSEAGHGAGPAFVTIGVVTASVGVVSYLIGAALNRPAVWQLEVSGKVVKRTAPAVPAALPVAGLSTTERGQ